MFLGQGHVVLCSNWLKATQNGCDVITNAMNDHERIAAKFRVECLEAEPSKLTSTKTSKKEILKNMYRNMIYNDA